MAEELNIVKAKIKTYLKVKLEEPEYLSKFRELLLPFKNCQSFSSYYKKNSNAIFPLYYCFNEVKDKFPGFSEKVFDSISMFLDDLWQLELVKVIIPRRTKLTQKDIEFVKSIQFNPVSYGFDDLSFLTDNSSG